MKTTLNHILKLTYHTEDEAFTQNNTALVGRILMAIHNASQRQAARRLRRHFSLAFIFSMVSTVATCYALFALYASAAQSGFIQYLSLLFSDWHVVFANAADYALLMLESVPVLAVASACAAFLVALVSFGYMVGYRKQLLYA